MQTISIIQGLLIFLIIFSALFYGGVTTFAFTIIEGTVALMVLFWLWDMAYKRTLSLVKSAFLVPAVLFLLLIVFQLLPMPLSLIKFISPKAAYLYETFLPADALTRFFSLSIYPQATVSELLKLLSYIGILFLLVYTTETKKQITLIINTIIFLGVAMSVFGIIQKYAYSGKVYWFDAPNSAGASFGPFVNRNHFAGYINMVIPLALGYLLTEMSLSKRVIYATSIGVMSLAAFLSLSRAGILVYIAVLLFMLFFCSCHERIKSKTKIFSAWVFLILFFFISFMDIKVVLDRMSTLLAKDSLTVLGRGYSWLDILRIWRDFPVFGSGLGTFANISAMYKTIPSQSLVTYAHNDYLQLLSEAGLAGFILVSLFFILYFISVLKMWLNRRNYFVVYLVLGGLASIFGMLAHSLLDFNLHIPANALLFFIIIGLVYRLTFTHFKASDNVTAQ